MHSKSNFLSLVDGAVEKLQKSPFHVDLGSSYPIAVIGDIHGFYDVFEAFQKLIDEYSAKKVVFLGDYVDRGYEGVEVLESLLNFYLSEGDKVVMLRGNHEDLRMNRVYGFYGELISKLGSKAVPHIGLLYSNLPLSASNKNAFFVHGGVPCVDCINVEKALKISYVAGLKRGNDHITDKVIFQMLWNDPDGSIEWFEVNSVRGGGSYYYGRRAWANFLNENGLDFIIRGHEVVDGILIWRDDGRYVSKVKNEEVMYYDYAYHNVITLFSSRYHLGRAGSLILFKDEMRFFEL